jgi:CheY-like chemotaxis protein
MQKNETNHILLAEDDETDVMLMRRALKDAGITNPLHVVSDGQEAIDYLTELQQAPGPSDRMPLLAILDLKMPRMNGLDVLQWLRSEPGTRCVPAIVFSSSAHQHDVERAYAAGANAFVVKTASTGERIEFARFIKSWIHFSLAPLACTEGFRAAQSVHASANIVPAPFAKP